MAKVWCRAMAVLAQGTRRQMADPEIRQEGATSCGQSRDSVRGDTSCGGSRDLARWGPI